MEFVLILLFINYCIIYLYYNCKPTFAYLCILLIYLRANCINQTLDSIILIVPIVTIGTMSVIGSILVYGKEGWFQPWTTKMEVMWYSCPVTIGDYGWP